MSEAIDLTGFTGGKTCPICGKDFIVMYPQLYTYKRKVDGSLKYFCNYSCVRKFDKEKEEGEKEVGIVFNEKNQKAIDIALAGGDPIAYLRETGSKDAAKMWYYIRRQLKERAPELYEKLPSCTKDCRVRNAGPKKPQKAEVPEAQAAQFPGIETPEDTFKAGMDLAKIKPAPLKYDGMTVRALEGEFGSYHFDTIKGVEYIDYENKDGDELSMTVDNWRGFLAELSHAAAILGVQL